MTKVASNCQGSRDKICFGFSEALILVASEVLAHKPGITVVKKLFQEVMKTEKTF
jgi:hypothetical protein